MRILGIDPGFATIGFGLVEAERAQVHMVTYGAITTPAGLPLPKRLLQIGNDMRALIAQFSPDAMAIEKLYFGNNVTTGIGVAQARGVILAEAEREGLAIYEYDPSQVKSAVTGYGKAEKRQVQFMVKEMLRLAAIPKPDDAADALAVAVCHAHTSRFGKLYGIR